MKLEYKYDISHTEQDKRVNFVQVEQPLIVFICWKPSSKVIPTRVNSNAWLQECNSVQLHPNMATSLQHPKKSDPIKLHF
ncbi:trichothecene 3-O-acetyltransferase [Sesbania bispinosa]|nr:trichothecene 3-O-acetyltransferase [Sesbania bispinosa]